MPGDVFVDATLGLGGHTQALLETEATLRVIGIDQDVEAMKLAKERLKQFGDRVEFRQGNFADIRKLADSADGILADLGVSSLQFDSETRGFSFRFDAPLDMRMDAEGDDETAAELLERLSEEEIANIIYGYGEERFSRRIARRIVERRSSGSPVRTTKELAELVERSVPRKPKDKIHPATKTFQALRIAVNRELEVLEGFLKDSIDLLRPNGRLAVISFHSLEDRMVKQAFLKASGKCQCPPRIPQCICGAAKQVEILTKKPITAGDDELDVNPRSRSAKLRAVRKLG
jgi:16S rRNA (cytosine1402-N4)-methyltransferase